MYLINNSIEFWPDERLLISHSNREITVSLSGPASLCLLLLIKSDKNIVSSDELLTQVWRNDGVIVPLNTLYQNISIIRRGIKSISKESTNILDTVPKKGFKINDLVNIVEFPDFTDPLVGIPKENLGSPVKQLNQELRKRPKINILMVGGGIFTLLFLSLSAISHFKKDNYFENYTIREDKDGCHFIRRQDSLPYKQLFSVDKFMMECNLYPWVYVTKLPHIPISSIIACRSDILKDGDNQCVSVIFKEDLK